VDVDVSWGRLSSGDVASGKMMSPMMAMRRALADVSCSSKALRVRQRVASVFIELIVGGC